MSSLVEIGPVVLEKKIFNSCQCVFTILQLSPLDFVRTNWNPPLLRLLCAKLVENGPVVLEKEMKM